MIALNRDMRQVWNDARPIHHTEGPSVFSAVLLDNRC